MPMRKPGDPGAPPSCRVALFAALQIAHGERLITRFQTRQAGALLAYLAYHRGHAHRREALAAMLWPEVDTGVTRHRLGVALSSLRRQLEPPGLPPGTYLHTDRETVALVTATVATDVTEFADAL